MSSRRHNAPGTPGVNLGLIITPMLDMSFQILAFFIMTYHPSALEGHISGSLAPPEKVAMKAPENVTLDVIPPSVPEDQLLPEVQQAPTVIVRTDRDNPGAPAKIYLKRDQTQTDPAEVADATKNWAQAKQDLAKELRRVKSESGDQKNVKIEADGDLKQEWVMQVYDVCNQAGFPKIHFVPPPMLRNAKK
jgi:biopolymer transport protein ExbD